MKTKRAVLTSVGPGKNESMPKVDGVGTTPSEFNVLIILFGTDQDEPLKSLRRTPLKLKIELSPGPRAKSQGCVPSPPGYPVSCLPLGGACAGTPDTALDSLGECLPLGGARVRTVASVVADGWTFVPRSLSSGFKFFIQQGGNHFYFQAGEASGPTRWRFRTDDAQEVHRNP